MDTMKLELRNKDAESITSMTDGTMTLAEYGMESGMTIHVVDDSASNDKEDEDAAFQLSEEEYAKREGNP